MKPLPMTKDEMTERGWDACDIILVSGDAYIDHPSFGTAIIGRVLEAEGYRVGIIAQPSWDSCKDVMRLGRPRLFFGVTSGNIDSMVAHYTANKKVRNDDAYSPEGKAGLRPDRALLIYTNKIREAYGSVPIVLGGLEASMRRLAHYDYWNNHVRRSVLLDAKADLLVYGMGEQAIREIAHRLAAGESIANIDAVRGTVCIKNSDPQYDEATIVRIPSYEEVESQKGLFNKAFRAAYDSMMPAHTKRLIQPHGARFVIQNPPSLPLTTKELDALYELPYTRHVHPFYGRHRIPAYETTKNSLVSHRGCPGECSFCSLFLHQGRIVQSRSTDSLVREAKVLSEMPGFRGTITDVGGPTANAFKASCELWKKGSYCTTKHCFAPDTCTNLRVDYQGCIDAYRRIAKLPRVKHVFIGSGFRFDLFLNPTAEPYLKELCEHYISGQMKVAPEHCVDSILTLMNKPSFKKYEHFEKLFERINKRIPQRVYLANYFISAHPGARKDDARQLAFECKKRNLTPEQVQDFIPLPMTLSSCMYWTGVHPMTGASVYVPKDRMEREAQRVMIQSPVFTKRTPPFKRKRKIKH